MTVGSGDRHGDGCARRRGRGYDPQVVDAALADPEQLLRTAATPDVWERVMALEPQPVVTIPQAVLESVVRALGDFVDLKVAYLHGHSSRVAERAACAATAMGCSTTEVTDVRLAGFVHDLGRMAVPNGIWEKAGPLSDREWERVRLHPYYTARILERSEVLAPLAPIAAAHHERLDGSGYYRGAAGGQLEVGARLLSAADAWDAMTHDRPYRAALPPEQAREELEGVVRAGTLDTRTANAVLEAAGARPTRARQGYPAGLTEREVEVLRRHRPRPDEPADRRGARDRRQDRRRPRPTHLHQDRRLHPRGRGAVRNAARPRRVDDPRQSRVSW